MGLFENKTKKLLKSLKRAYLLQIALLYAKIVLIMVLPVAFATDLERA